MIRKETATDIALAYREIERGEALLAKVNEQLAKAEPDLRDSLGRPCGVQLGLPTTHSTTAIFDVPWTLARPIIEAHIARQKQKISELSAAAKLEAENPAT